MDYKATLNLPKTSFPMKGNLPESEPKILKRWQEEHLYDQILARRKGGASFLLHDGPPYANGDIHMGHALNKVLKDLIVRYQLMRGRRVYYVPGWDCHGLPIEYALMKELNVTKHQVDTVDFRRKARGYAKRYVEIQREQFKRLGVIGDWDHPYLTLEPDYVADALRVLKNLVEKGYITRARRPVNWCWVCETALAEAEVEYELHTSPSIYVKFPLTEPESGARRGTYLVIWTTTPWTLLGNVAVAVHPEGEYALRQVGPNEIWITLANLPESARRNLGAAVDPTRVKQVMKGRELEGKRYRHPFGLREGQVVLADYVSMEEGTGLVHTAPGFGAEDFATGKKYGLEVVAPVDSQGKFVGLPQPLSQFNGQQVQRTNPAIVELLKESGHLIHAGEEPHQYPHCWRCHTPIIFRATDQWFLSVEHQGLREKLLAAIANDIQWIPPEGSQRITGMVKARPDWCLSRQRLWGIPIPALICKGCGEARLEPGVIEKFAAVAQSEPEGVDRWFTEPVSRWLPSQAGLPERFACRCGKSDFGTGTDILDVWFDSGVSHQAVLTRREGLSFPADLYLEGSDQHRGWFQVSLITSVALHSKPPYRAVLTHGFVVDGEGRKMSKSLGNVIAPQEVVSSSGADVLRLWVASSDYREDVRLSPLILAQVAEVYRKIRNTLRFCLANLSDFDPAGRFGPAGRFDPAQMEGLDRWVLHRLGKLVEEVTEAYDSNSFHRVVKAIHEFCTVFLSNFYLDVIKDALYTFHPKDPRRLSAQAALLQIVETLILLIAPILPATAEEAWTTLNEGARLKPGALIHRSVHLEDWPKAHPLPQDPSLEESWARLLQFRDQAMKALERAREAGLIGDPLEAELEIGVRSEETQRFLESHRSELAAACIVSSLKIRSVNDRSVDEVAPPPDFIPPPQGGGIGPAGAGPPKADKSGGGVAMNVAKAAGTKCQRCWMRLPSVGESPEHPTLCHRCVEVLKVYAR